ncbi:MAG: hypothetical protein HY000_41555 [Planctomycetes bacterium]|nr:hypothetical protein [Planctomycetota bacterium]
MTKYNPQKTGDGAGKVETDRRPVYVAFRLVNYNIDDPAMKSQHLDFIEREILPVISTGVPWMVRLRGMCSRSGDHQHNLELSTDRAVRVEGYLLGALQRDKRRAYRIDKVGVGFTAARGQSDKDGADDRAVVIEVFNAFKPPKPKPEKPDPPPNPQPGPLPAYENDGTPMFAVPETCMFITQGRDNTVAFAAGQIVDVHLSGLGAAPVQITSGNEKRTVLAAVGGTVEQFATFGKPPVGWKFDFTMNATVGASASVASVCFYSDWVPGMPRPGRGEPRPKTP